MVALVLALGGATAVDWWLGGPWVAPAWLSVAVFAAVLLPLAAGWRRRARTVGGVLLALMTVGSLVQSIVVNDLADRL